MARVQLFTGPLQLPQTVWGTVEVSEFEIEVGTWPTMDRFSGSFTFDPTGTMLTGGTVTSYTGYVDGMSVLSVIDIALPALQVAALVQAGEALLLLEMMLAGDDEVRPFEDSGHLVYDAVLHGYGGNDVLFGGSGHDSLYGDEGNDTFFVRGGDLADGGVGLDSAKFVFHPTQYVIERTASGVQVTALSTLIFGEVSTLVSVERLVFFGYNHCIALDIDGHAGQAYRLYQAAFDRTPDLAGLGFQIGMLDSGQALTSVAGNFIASPEFQRTYGALDDSHFVTQLYANVLHRNPDVGGLNFHVTNLAAGMSRAQVLVGFSESPENQVAVIGAIQDGIHFII
jgi:hypothetical protein